MKFNQTVEFRVILRSNKDLRDDDVGRWTVDGTRWERIDTFTESFYVPGNWVHATS